MEETKMKNNRWRIIAILLCLVMLLGVIMTGCDNAKDDAKDDGKKDEEPSSTYDELLDIAWIVYCQYDTMPVQDSPIEMFIEE